MSNIKPLKSERLTLRALDPADLNMIHKWENDSSAWKVGCTTTPLSRYQIWEYLQNYDADLFKSRQLRLIIELNSTQEAVGIADFYDFDPMHRRAFIGLYIDENFRGKGIASDVVKLLHDYAFHFIGLHQLCVHVPTENTACRALFEKIGYRETGILHEWLKDGDHYTDVAVLQYIHTKK